MSTPEDKALEDALEKTQETTTDAPAETPVSDPDPAPEPEKAAEPPAKAAATPAPARKSRTQAQKDKRKADTERRKKAIEAAPRPPDPSAEDAAEQKRKSDIRAKMAATQGEIDELGAQADQKKDELRSLSDELYPHLGASDHHTVAVAGYIKSQKALRATRASNPETLKRMIAAASKSPIDAAMASKKGRGLERPNRQPAGVSSDKTAAASE